MHAKLHLFVGCPCNQIGAYRILFWQISSEIHLLPLIALDDVLIPGKSKFSEMPSLDKVQLTSY